MLNLKAVSFCAAISAGILLGPGPATAQPGPFPPGNAPPGRSRPTGRASAKAGSKAQPGFLLMKDYKVQPPDLLLVEVLEALPGRPVSGERLVRPDGKISLGFYGEIPVAGLTITEIKEKVVERMRNYVTDSTLGLVEIDVETGEPKIDPRTQKVKRIASRDSDRVFVDVTAYNSHVYYVQGAVYYPGRMPVTGRETVLDALIYAGGPCPRADRDRVALYRPNRDGTLHKMPVDIDQITMGDDPSTNYQLRPGDRLVVPVLPGPQNSAANTAPQRGRSEARRPAIEPTLFFERSLQDNHAGGYEDRLRELDNRLQSIESKLKEISSGLASIKELRRLHGRGPRPGPPDRPNTGDREDDALSPSRPPFVLPHVPEEGPDDGGSSPFQFDEPPAAGHGATEADRHNPFQMGGPPAAADERPKAPGPNVDAPRSRPEAPPTEKPSQGTYEDNE